MGKSDNVVVRIGKTMENVPPKKLNIFPTHEKWKKMRKWGRDLSDFSNTNP